MFWRVRPTFAVLGFVLPALVLLVAPAGESSALVALGAVTAAAIVTLMAPHGLPSRVLTVATAGPPSSAQRRRRGSYLRQSSPDTAGRPRPRAPGAVAR
ncbi:DUF6412 domain-containing protein [Nocardia arizonensis]|uniref:DUF6412 domain-containing protein n=1 Tax=Nocardia arizonensis TaxID=1141647 RepID=UPI0006D05077|nr:DUF6412 domain-containing protein [Nocardia arizonensis]